ncbi:MAG: amidase [Gammaproteobacteria bacterium]|jgi:amidase|nr:amidase [Gammaproteobacteria bacterium]MBT3859849.1 amidase [Gammaproteobacteria bacterium]MBT3988497.1 amidase [Gammaproteobacteria bacterium]MBT4660181.1 amidase [Gammaproteobacteria bacterium]MBT4893796.1 amidase [Gammaproteobacteria bacterium]
MKRREFLSKGLTVSTAVALGSSSLSQSFAAELPADIINMSASKLSAAIRQRQVSCEEVMSAYLQRIHRYNPVYNAIVSLVEDDQLLAQAREADQALASDQYRGWMHGMPHAVKDLTAVAGLRYTSGSPMFADRIAQEDSAMVARMRRAGAIFIGKTNTPEFGVGSQSYNPVFGATGCAYNPELTSGGSSGGAASGLGTHMLPVADGSDMMGSLRNPGAFNNVIGFRPSTGLMGGGDPFSRSLSSSGPMGRNTEDAIRLLHTIAAEPASHQPQALKEQLPGADRYGPLNLADQKIGWLGNFDNYLTMEPGVIDLCESNLQTLSAAGATVESCTVQYDMAELWQCWLDLRNWSRTSMRGYYENSDTRPMIKPELAWEIEQSYSLTADAIYQANAARSRWYREMNRLFDQYDFLVLPTAQVFPYSKDLHWPTEIDGRQMDTYHRWMEVVIPASLAGIPVVNVPAGFDQQGRPMGMQIMGRFGEDKKVLEFALAYEGVTDHLSRRPAGMSV